MEWQGEAEMEWQGEAAKSVAQHVQGICIDDDYDDDDNDNGAQLLHFHNFHNFSHFSPMTDSSRQSSGELCAASTGSVVL